MLCEKKMFNASAICIDDHASMQRPVSKFSAFSRTISPHDSVGFWMKWYNVYLSTTRITMQYHLCYIFFDIPRIFLEQKLIYYGYFKNINALSAGKRHVLGRSQHDS